MHQGILVHRSSKRKLKKGVGMRGKKGRDYALKHLLKRIRKEEEIGEILDDDDKPV